VFVVLIFVIRSPRIDQMRLIVSPGLIVTKVLFPIY
jgi:hypothetical protein